MTSLEVHGLVAPFVLFGICAGIAWWSHHQAARENVVSKPNRAHPAE